MKRKLFSCLAFAFGLAATAQHSPLFDINKGSGDSNPDKMFLFDGKIYFQADTGNANSDYSSDGDIGDELWILDPSDDSLTYIDITAGTGNSSPALFFEFSNELYFMHTNKAPYTTDGTPSGTTQVTALINNMDDMIELNGVLYFINNNEPNVGELWQWDGTNAATRVTRADATQEETVFSFNNRESVGTTALIQVFNNKIYFAGNLSINGTDDTGMQVLEYDPSTDLFRRVTNIADTYRLHHFVEYNNELYFSVRTNTDKNTANDFILYKTNGTTTEAITAVNDAVDVTKAKCVWKDKLYLSADDSNGISQLYSFDASTNIVTQITFHVEKGHDPTGFITPNDSDDYLYYLGEKDVIIWGTNWMGQPAIVGDNNNYLHRTDGSSYSILEDNLFISNKPIRVNDFLYLEGDNGSSGDEVYKFDMVNQTLSDEDIKLVGINNVYPNPAKDFIMVDKTLVDAAYSIYDITGKVVKQGVLKSQRLDFNLNTGLYIFKAQTDLGFFAQKIIVK